jgi:hypothetical protein
MINKIKELAIQANLNSDAVPYHLSDYNDYYYPEVENFAKLIVLECIKLLQNNYAPDDCLPQEEIEGCLKEHFKIQS